MQISSLSSRAKNIFLVDGGGHGCTMEHFTRSVFKNTETNIRFEPVRINPSLYDMKYMDSLETALKNVFQKSKKGDFAIIPVLALATLTALEQGINDILNKKELLTPQNLQTKKLLILEMLRKIFNKKSEYKKELEYIDPSSLEYGSTWGVINQINALCSKGVNVYIPTGHPIDYKIKGLAEHRGKKNDLYSYIATGKDKDESIKKIIQDARNLNYYNLNMLALSNAHIVNVDGLNGKPYIYSAYDTLVNDNERGVYNFYPVRNKSGSILGFSFHDRSTIEFDIKEYGISDSLNEILKFTGLPIRECLATKKETDLLRNLIAKGKDTFAAPDKLYKISDIFEAREIQDKRLNLLGDYINRSANNTFDVNQQEEILFQKCNCEGSTRPSVVSMWGSCFSAITAAMRDFLNTQEPR